MKLTLLAATMLPPVRVHAADLKAETVAAWDDYIRSVSVALQDRARPGGSFLWTYEKPERIAKVHNGEIVLALLAGPVREKCPEG